MSVWGGGCGGKGEACRLKLKQIQDYIEENLTQEWGDAIANLAVLVLHVISFDGLYRSPTS
jgi:hypothetical protein